MKNYMTIFIAILSLGISGSSWAQETDGKIKTQAAPNVSHRVTSNTKAGEDTWLFAAISGDWKLNAIWASVRPLGSVGEFQRIGFKRLDSGEFVAILPGELMQSPGVEYYIASEGEDGSQRDHFASAEQPHTLFVEGDTAKSKRAARLKRHRGQTSEFTLNGQFTSFGTSKIEDGDVIDGTWVDHEYETDQGSDVFWVTEAAYKHRPLGLIYDFSFGLGVLRGSSPFYTDTEGTTVFLSQSEGEPGLNYGFGATTLEFYRNFSMEGKVILGASDRGFAFGAGALLRVGRIEGTRLELGFEAIQDIGSDFKMKFAWDTIPSVPMGLSLEFTTMPDASLARSGTRFVYDVGWELSDSVTLTADLGLATRTSAFKVGYVGGLQAKYGF